MHFFKTGQKAIFSFIFIFLVCFLVSGQTPQPRRLIDDKPSLDTMSKAVQLLYNGHFDLAEQTALSIRKKYQNHPSMPLFTALLRYWRYMPVHQSPKELEAYRLLLFRTASLSEDLLKRNEKNPEAIFFNMMAYLMMARLNAETGEYIKAVSDARKAYVQLKKGMELKEKYPEFYFSTGLFHFYREFYPEAHPVYKPFAFFFESGDKKLGLQEMEVAANRSVYCKAEALTFLTFINLRYEDNLSEALRISKRLIEEYPNNNVYKLLRTEVLLEAEKYDAAEGLISDLLTQSSTFLFAPAMAFHGILHEKYFKKYELAKGFYLKSLQLAKPKRKSEDVYAFACYIGLGRIYKAENNMERARYYFRKAADSPNEKQKKEAKQFFGQK